MQSAPREVISSHPFLCPDDDGGHDDNDNDNDDDDCETCAVQTLGLKRSQSPARFFFCQHIFTAIKFVSLHGIGCI